MICKCMGHLFSSSRFEGSSLGREDKVQGRGYARQWPVIQKVRDKRFLREELWRNSSHK